MLHLQESAYGAHSCPGRLRRHVRSWRKPTPHSKTHPLVNRLNLAWIMEPTSPPPCIGPQPQLLFLSPQLGVGLLVRKDKPHGSLESLAILTAVALHGLLEFIVARAAVLDISVWTRRRR